MRRSFAFLLAIIILVPAALSQTGQITLEDLWLRYKYYPRSPAEFRWMQDDHFYSELEEGKAIVSQSIENTESQETVLDLSALDFGGKVEAAQIESYEFSADESLVLLKAEVTGIYRHSSEEICFVADRKSGKVQPINEGKKIRLGTFSPDGSKLAFFYENNLYYRDLGTGERVQITSDGAHNAIINGHTDWVYEEEFAFTRAFEWSPDGNKIVFIRFDESAVPEFSMAIYGSLYPQQYTFKYPKAGEVNSAISLHIYDLQSGNTIQGDIGSEADQYIARLTWTPLGEVALMRLNRLQNQLDVLLLDGSDGSARTLLTETSETYVREATDDKWYFLDETGDMIWMSERSGYQHIYRYDRKKEKLIQITSGDWEVAEILGVDQASETIFYLSTEVSPLERHLFSVNFKGKKKQQLTKGAGVHTITASSAMNFFVDSYGNRTTPTQTRLIDREGKILKVVEDNKQLARAVNSLDIREPEFFTFPTADGTELNGYMIKPADFDPSRKYPVLMHVYGGPGDQQVMDSWGLTSAFDYMWHQMLTQKGYIIACVDNRGTGGRGRDFRASTYADLGNLETVDQIEAAKYLGGLDYVDAERIGIWGWSYGGYMTSLCLTKGNGLFKAGIAVAPVTNWRYYDTIYTERYLKTPQLNAAGYDDNSPINFAQDLQGSYLLIHGTADDNVHFQNSMEWVDALVNANKQFDTFFYPNKNHGIYGGYTRYHLFKKMTDFVLENL